jgi:RNA polymerase-interacting CarD/CdnL/TRCF family regulator
MLENARRILLSELVLAKNVAENQMEEIIDGYLS